MFVGMDFGTTNSGMSVYDGTHLSLIPLDPTNRNPHVARTALYITNDSYVHIGRGATDRYYEQNLNRPSKFEQVRVGEIELTFAELPTFIRDVFINKDIYSPGRLFLSFKMGLSSTNYLGTIVGNHYFFLEDIIATYLYTTKYRAEQYLGRQLDTIVLGRPVRFSDDPEQDDFAKERLIQSAFRAGWKRVYLQYEPIAAAYYYETTIQDQQNVLIFDFGGGTLDMSIVQVGGQAKSRVIANNGIPIAGDTFDQHIVRAKYPKHFGEGTMYKARNTELPVPSALYAAFSDWQSLLNLQLPENIETLRRIEQTSLQPLKIRAFQKLITGQYGLKIYDIAEQAKQQLSERLSARLSIKSDDLFIVDKITRGEFESLIRSDVRAIEARLDELMQEAGMQPNDIDAVIRTGGSSQIPLFVDMLVGRFGEDKVSDIDAFASVTSGLGVIAHQIESGELDLPYYDVDTYTGTANLHADVKTGVPSVDLTTLKRIIQTQENSNQESHTERVLLVRNDNQKLYAAPFQPDMTLSNVSAATFANMSLSNEDILLLTSDYVSYKKSPTELASLCANGLHIEEMEGFRHDSFSQEYIHNVMNWREVESAEVLILTSTLGYTKKFLADRIMPKLSLSVPYTFSKMRGYPAVLVGARNTEDYLALTHAGRIARIPINDISLLEARPIAVPLRGAITHSLAALADDYLLLVTRSGYSKRVHVGQIPYTLMNTNGEKLMQRSNVIHMGIYQEDKTYYVLTNQRIAQIETSSTPICNLDKTNHKLLKLKKNEVILSVFCD